MLFYLLNYFTSFSTLFTYVRIVLVIKALLDYLYKDWTNPLPYKGLQFTGLYSSIIGVI